MFIEIFPNLFQKIFQQSSTDFFQWWIHSWYFILIFSEIIAWISQDITSETYLGISPKITPAYPIKPNSGILLGIQAGIPFRISPRVFK